MSITITYGTTAYSSAIAPVVPVKLELENMLIFWTMLSEELRLQRNTDSYALLRPMDGWSDGPAGWATPTPTPGDRPHSHIDIDDRRDFQITKVLRRNVVEKNHNNTFMSTTESDGGFGFLL